MRCQGIISVSILYAILPFAEHSFDAATAETLNDLACGRGHAPRFADVAIAATPNMSVRAMKDTHPMRHIPRYYDRLVEGLERSGLE